MKDLNCLNPRLNTETLHYIEQEVKETEQAFLKIKKSTPTGKSSVNFSSKIYSTQETNCVI